MEHLKHFGLTQDPFENEPDLRAYFESRAHQSAQRRAERGVRQGKGLTLLVGSVGTGKTLLTRRILEGLEEEMYEANLMVMVKGAADSGSVLARFARQLGVDDLAGERSGLLAQIYEQLAVVREDGRHGVLIIDDAHVMSADTLAEMGGLLNLEYEDRRLLSLVLVGLPELEQALARDASLGQRVDVRVQLGGLSAEDAEAYLAHRIERVGGDPAILSGDAVAALHKYGHGRPRLMNTLADNALFEAFDAGRPHVEASDVETAAADLGIGPDPGATFQNAAAAAAHGSPAPSGGASATGSADSATSARGGASAGELPSLEPDASASDLGSLLESAPSLGDDDVEEEEEAVSHLELENALDEADDAAGDGDEEDALLAALEPEPAAEEAPAAARARAPEPEAAASNGDDEIDDLFAELLDD